MSVVEIAGVLVQAGVDVKTFDQEFSREMGVLGLWKKSVRGKPLVDSLKLARILLSPKGLAISERHPREGRRGERFGGGQICFGPA